MTERSIPRARRLWVDPRFLIGIVLVVVSVLGVWAVVAGATRGTRVYVAAHTLVAGDRVTAGDLTLARVRIGGSSDRYLGEGALPAGSIARTTVAAGELLPRSALGSSAPEKTGRVVVRVTGPLPSVVRVGSRIDVWASESERSGDHGAPKVIADDVTVAGITHDDGMVSSDAVSVEVQAATSDLGALLAATADGDVVTLVAPGDVGAGDAGAADADAGAGR